jgi:hypothetical protein
MSGPALRISFLNGVHRDFEVARFGAGGALLTVEDGSEGRRSSRLYSCSHPTPFVVLISEVPIKEAVELREYTSAKIVVYHGDKWPLGVIRMPPRSDSIAVPYPMFRR